MKGKPLFETPGEEIMITLNTLYPILKRLYAIRSIGVFGRIARGEDPPGGVIELLVEFSPAMESYEVYAGLCTFLEEKFGQEVRLVTARMLDAQPEESEVREEVPGHPLPGDDPSLLRMIIDECAAVREQCKEMSFARFSRNDQLKQAMAEALDRAGLAAAALPKEFHVLHSGVDWTALISLCRRLIRNPYGVDGVILWNAAHEFVPAIEMRAREVQNKL